MKVELENLDLDNNGNIEHWDGFKEVDNSGMVYCFKNNGRKPNDWEECQEVYSSQLNGDTVSGPGGWATMVVFHESQLI